MNEQSVDNATLLGISYARVDQESKYQVGKDITYISTVEGTAARVGYYYNVFISTIL